MPEPNFKSYLTFYVKGVPKFRHSLAIMEKHRNTQYDKNPFFLKFAKIGHNFGTPCTQNVQFELKFGFSMLKLVWVLSFFNLSSPIGSKMKLLC